MRRAAALTKDDRVTLTDADADVDRGLLLVRALAKGAGTASRSAAKKPRKAT